MKIQRKAKDQQDPKTRYTKTLKSLCCAVTRDYSKVIQKEQRAIVLGYD